MNDKRDLNTEIHALVEFVANLSFDDQLQPGVAGNPILLSPPGLICSLACLPTACAVGCVLSPLCGCALLVDSILSSRFVSFGRL